MAQRPGASSSRTWPPSALRAVTQRPSSPPRKPRYLKFCQDYNTQACCIPGHDLENQVQFENLIGALGPGCKNPMMYPELRFFYCLGLRFRATRSVSYKLYWHGKLVHDMFTARR